MEFIAAGVFVSRFPLFEIFVAEIAIERFVVSVESINVPRDESSRMKQACLFLMETFVRSFSFDNSSISFSDFFFFFKKHSGIFNIELGVLITRTLASLCLSLEFLIEIFQFQEIR